MKITEVSLQVLSAGTAADFYDQVLGLAVLREPGGATVTVGTSRLTLVENAEVDGAHHLAITIPSTKFAEAKAWIQQRVPLLSTAEADEFECSPAWNARSLYFGGPGRCVLELIVRRDLDNATAGPFTSEDLLCISEIGVVVPDVPAAAAELATADITPYRSPPGETFAAVGDTDGLLILVNPGRAWFPTTDRVAQDSPVTIRATGGRPGTYSLGVPGSFVVDT